MLTSPSKFELFPEWQELHAESPGAPVYPDVPVTGCDPDEASPTIRLIITTAIIWVLFRLIMGILVMLMVLKKQIAQIGIKGFFINIH